MNAFTLILFILFSNSSFSSEDIFLTCIEAGAEKIECGEGDVYILNGFVNSGEFYQHDFSHLKKKTEIFSELIFSNDIRDIGDIDLDRLGLSASERESLETILPELLDYKKKIDLGKFSYSQKLLLKKSLTDNLKKLTNGELNQDEMIRTGKEIGLFSTNLSATNDNLSRDRDHLAIGDQLGVRNPDDLGGLRTVGREIIKGPDDMTLGDFRANEDPLERGSRLGIKDPENTTLGNNSSLQRDNGYTNTGRRNVDEEGGGSTTGTLQRDNGYTNTGRRNVGDEEGGSTTGTLQRDNGYTNTGRRNVGDEDNRGSGTPLTTDSFGNDSTIMNSGKPFDSDLDDLVDNNPPANDPPTNDPPANDPPANDPPANDPPANDPPANDPPANDPPANDPPANDPPANDPPANDPPKKPRNSLGETQGEAMERYWKQIKACQISPRGCKEPIKPKESDFQRISPLRNIEREGVLDIRNIRNY
ncbi:hypothetical protein [Halobacteriovorax sp. HLS]|uniref:hypothetical protein n=1 Tax=Halobacteriovorax sp. HLS TaxID=2234000 RepID=UPI0013E3CD04|nr:hypothetical protein [Halobacteriovorax sp. HLS]